MPDVKDDGHMMWGLTCRQVLDVLAGQKLDPRLAWKLRKGKHSLLCFGAQKSNQ